MTQTSPPRATAATPKDVDAALRERMKELRGLYTVSALAAEPDLSLDHLFQRAVDSLPAAWRFPEHIGIRICYRGSRWTGGVFEEGPWRLEAPFHGAGRIEVSCRQPPPDDAEPFLREEVALLKAVADQLGMAAQRDEVLRSLAASSAELEARLRIENLLVEVAASFIGLDASRFDAVMDATLTQLGEFAAVDRCYLFRLDREGETVSNTHEWCAEGVEPQKDLLQQLPCQALPWWMAQLYADAVINIRDVGAMPAAAAREREVLEAQSIRSVLVVPIWQGTRLGGFIGFDWVASRTDPSDHDVRLLRLIAQLIGDACARFADDARMALLTRALRVASRCGDAVLHAQDEDALLDSVCLGVVDEGGYRAAWVGYAEPGGAVSPRAWAGAAQSYLEGIRITWDDSPTGCGPGGRAIRSGEVQVSNCLSRDPSFTLWKERAERLRLRSSLVLPLRQESGTFGFLAIYAAEEQAFDTDEIALLTRVADNVAHGIAALRDRNERDLAEAALRRSEERFELALAGSNDGIWDWDIKAGTLFWSDRVFELLGHSPGAFEPSLEVFENLVHPEQRASVLEALNAHLERAVPYAVEQRLQRKDGEYGWFLARGEAVRDTAGRPVRMVGSMTDIGAAKQAEASLQLANRAIEAARNGIIIVDATRMAITYVNPAIETITGYAADELLGRDPMLLAGSDTQQPGLRELALALKERRSAELLLRGHDRDNTLYWHELYLSPVFDEAGELTHWVSIINDVTEQQRYQRQLEYRAQHDELTGLANRNLMRDRLDQSLIYADRHGRNVAVLFVGLDRFKLVNDSLGHPAGDELLKVIAKRLVGLARRGDTVARHGGDTFVVLLADVAREEDVSRIARRVLEAASEPVRIDGHDIHVTSSIGISLFPRDGAKADRLIQSADTAMYQAKELGRNNFQFFRAELNARMLERLTLEGRLQRALREQEMVLYYQPQVRLRDGSVAGVEALVRWRHPELGLVAPCRFIPLAEETGLIVPLGDWVLREACRQMARWRAGPVGAMTTAVNLSVRQLEQEDFPERVAAILQESGLEPHLLELEVTESALMAEPEQMVERLKRIKALGCKLSLDDFGTGYSSLGYLKKYPFDRLKIDRSFVSDITTEPHDAAIAKTIIAMARTLGLEVLAEGVETESQLTYLQRNGCDLVQGFLLGHPEMPDDLERQLREGAASRVVGPTARQEQPALLVVDDEPNITRALTRLLRRDGYRVLTSNDPHEAFDLLAMNDVHVIISDQRMPQMTGTELLSQVKELYPDVVRIVLSGYTDLTTVAEAVNKGWVYRFLTKPWEDDELRAHVREGFERYQRNRQRGR